MPALDDAEWLNRIIALTRKYTDEPVVNAKYSTSELAVMIESAFQTILADINTSTDAPILCRYSMSLGASTQDYLLPPSVGSVRRIAKLNTTTGLPEWQLVPGSMQQLQGPSLTLEGRTLRLTPKWTSTHTVEVLYVPNGDFRLLYGTPGTFVDTEYDHVLLPASPILGTLDTRENAYVGAILRVWSTDGDFYLEERTITAYNNATRQCTVSPNFSQLWYTEDVTNSKLPRVEVIPAYGRLIESIVCWYLAREIAAISGNTKKYSLAEAEYRKKLRALRLQLDTQEGISGDSFDPNVPTGYAPNVVPYSQV
jgi:hypothetical protein